MIDRLDQKIGEIIIKLQQIKEIFAGDRRGNRRDQHARQQQKRGSVHRHAHRCHREGRVKRTLGEERRCYKNTLAPSGHGLWQRGVRFRHDAEFAGNVGLSGQLLDASVLEVRRLASHEGGSLVDSLLGGGYVGEEELDALFRTELEEDIYDLFFWKNARFEFFEGATSFEGREGVVNERFTAGGTSPS